MLSALLSVLVAVPLVCNAVPPSRIGVKIPLNKRAALTEDGVVNPAALQSQTKRLQAKLRRGFEAYERNTGKPHPNAKNFVSKRDTGADPLTDDDESLWQGGISVASVDFDTGSSDLFLPGTNCDVNCDGHKLYDTGASSTAKDQDDTFLLGFGDGSSVQGEIFTDTVTVAGLTATDQAVGSSTQYSTGFAADEFPPDGLMGMAFPAISEFGANPVFQTLIAQGQVDEPVFAFKLSTSGSELFLGGVNNDLFTGEFTQVPVTQEAFWQVDLDAVNANGNAALTDLGAIIDTGTTLIVGDTNSVAQFYAAVPGAQDASDTIGDGFFTFPCDSVPDVSFTFAGTDFSVSPDTFNLGLVSEGSSDCVGGIVSLPPDSLPGDSLWVLGDVFMTNVYTSFDVGNSQAMVDLALVNPALESNRQHQFALTNHAEILTTELAEIDNLLKSVDSDVSDDEPGMEIEVPGANPPTSIIPWNDFSNEESPFYEEAMRRSRYIRNTTMHTMKARELDALTEGVKAELTRLKAIDNKKKGLPMPSTNDVDLNGDVSNVNWSIVAERVNDVSSAKRTPEELRIKWLGDRRPSINHSEWSASELDQLKELGTNRTPIECMRRGYVRTKHTWSAVADRRLLEAVEIYGLENWGCVALYVSEHATPGQCQMRYTRTLDPALKKGAWSPEEDARLRSAVSILGTSWQDVAAFVPGRNNDQCRERYTDCLSHEEKVWTPEEDTELLTSVARWGLKWKIISQHMQTRDTDCRTRYTQLTKKDGKKEKKAKKASTSGMKSVHVRTDRSGTTPPPTMPIHQIPSFRATLSTSTTTSFRFNAMLDKGKGREAQSVTADSSSTTPGSSSQTPSTAAETSGSTQSRPKPRPKPRKKRKEKERETDSGPTVSDTGAGPSTSTAGVAGVGGSQSPAIEDAQPNVVVVSDQQTTTDALLPPSMQQGHPALPIVNLPSNSAEQVSIDAQNATQPAAKSTIAAASTSRRKRRAEDSPKGSSAPRKRGRTGKGDTAAVPDRRKDGYI
ncbi:hypothetical protein D9758_001280 [Tetrapyrgos nigripes]|uniref:Peptidase A1 domain-containing protein n=1 Tax=Tetrapyrgos nigripes TaxID=182062 RepID=A0A8H5LUK9_9AGAR|nr:hypothetical protein D9758_001280 [Tetrapyrgos nigripes]